MVKKDGMILEKHHRGRLHPRFLRFLSPGNGGTEGGVKTIERGLGRKWSPPWQRRDGVYRKNSTGGRLHPFPSWLRERLG